MHTYYTPNVTKLPVTFSNSTFYQSAGLHKAAEEPLNGRCGSTQVTQINYPQQLSLKSLSVHNGRLKVLIVACDSPVGKWAYS